MLFELELVPIVRVQVGVLQVFQPIYSFALFPQPEPRVAVFGELAPAMLFGVHPVAFVGLVIGPGKDAESLLFAVNEIALIFLIALCYEDSPAVLLVVYPIPLVFLSFKIIPSHRPIDKFRSRLFSYPAIRRCRCSHPSRRRFQSLAFCR